VADGSGLCGTHAGWNRQLARRYFFSIDAHVQAVDWFASVVTSLVGGDSSACQAKWRLSWNVHSEIELARQNLELARSTSDRLWEEYRAFEGPPAVVQGVMGPEVRRLLMEASESIGKIYAAEHALFAVEHGTPGVVGREVARSN
jgi:hypothetical protein